MAKDEEATPEKKPSDEKESIIIEGKIEQLEREQANAKKRDEEYKERQLRYNRLLVWFTGGLLFASLVSNGIYVYLALAAKQSADAAQESSAAANNAARVAGNTLIFSKDSAKNTLTEMKAQSQAMQEAAHAAKTQAETSIISADAAKSAANTARDALVRVQRPWLGVDGRPTYKLSQADFSVTVKNFGTAPALNVGVMMKRSASEDFEKNIVPTCDQARDKTKSGIYIFPGNTHTRRFVEIGGNTAPDAAFTLIGCIAYFGQNEDYHYTTFCFTSGLPAANTTNQPLTACAVKQDAK